MRQVLIIDDDEELCELLQEFLEPEGFQANSVHDGTLGAQSALAGNFDVVILDIMLPGTNGLECLRQIRSRSTVPVLMLTAKGDDVDRIIGLELGADDYLAKPCNPRELVARLRAILRRTQGMQTGHSSIARAGPVSVDSASRETMVNGRLVELTSTEFSILQLLVDEAGRVVTKESISLHALNRRLAQYDRSIDMHISHLRKKLGEAVAIKTVRGMGYQLTIVSHPRHGTPREL